MIKKLRIILNRPFVLIGYWYDKRRRWRLARRYSRSIKEILDKRDILYRDYLIIDKKNGQEKEASKLNGKIEALDWVIGKKDN